MKIVNFFKHFKTITNHKLIVMKYCFKVGLYKQGFLHDLSKYSITEFSAGIKYYQGNISPNGVQKKEEGYSKAWLHHKGRNKHHFEYWMDYSLNIKEGYVGMEMPINYVVEMFLDRLAASKNYLKDKYKDGSSLEYYNIGKDYYIINDKTRMILEELLTMLREKGEDATLNYIKHDLL